MLSKQIKFILITSAIFLSLFLFYKWQLATSSYYLNEGDKIYDTENFNEALKNYKYAEAINGEREIIYEAKIKRAEIFYDHWQLEKAEKELLEAINKKQNDYRAYELLGDVYLAKKEFDKSKNNYNQAIELNSNNNNLNLKLAKCLIANQKLDLAFQTLLFICQSPLRRDSDGASNAEVLYYLGLLDLGRDSLESPAERLQRDGNIAYSNYFKNLEDDEDYKNRITEIKKILEIYDDQKNSDYNAVLIADLYNKIGEPYFAINKINETIKNNPSYRDAWIISGKSNFIIGDYQKSLADFKKAFELDRDNSEIQFWIDKVE